MGARHAPPPVDVARREAVRGRARALLDERARRGADRGVVERGGGGVALREREEREEAHPAARLQRRRRAAR